MNQEKKEYIKISLESGEYLGLPTKKYEERKPYKSQNPKHVVSLIPGIIRNVFVKPNQTVKEGDVLLELEAMKMYNKVLAPFSGKIKKVYVKKGDKIPKDFLMVEYF